MECALELTNARFGYTTTIVSVGQLTLLRGKVCALVGSNGSGKTTLVRGIVNLTKLRNGSIIAGGVDVGEMSTSQIADLGVAYCPQKDGIFEQLTVCENLVLRRRNLRPADCAQHLSELGRPWKSLQAVLAKTGETLSGGTARLLASASALGQASVAALLDEPTAGLTESTTKLFFSGLRQLAQTRNIGVLIVTHREGIASLVDQVFTVSDGLVTST